jgi:hypothetical protein
MATKKPATPADEKLENQDFNLFDALAALDKKDYNYLDKLTEEQQKKFVPYMMTHWMSAIKGNGELAAYYVMNTEYAANKQLFNEYVQKHPKLQWQMLCASSPGIGKQFHQWIPHLSNKVATYRETPKLKDVKEYFTKIYPKVDSESIGEISEAFIEEHKKKVYIAKRFPELKLADIEVLAQTVTDDDIRNYERELGNE